jgi:hypothetical protein
MTSPAENCAKLHTPESQIAPPRQIKQIPSVRVIYSYRKATIGSTRIARRAGM